MEKKHTKEEAREWIEAGKPCRYRYGYGFRGAQSRPLTKEEALKLLPKYSFGMGFYELSFCHDTVIDHAASGPNCTVTHAVPGMILLFNEFSQNDMW